MWYIWEEITILFYGKVMRYWLFYTRDGFDMNNNYLINGNFSTEKQKHCQKWLRKQFFFDFIKNLSVKQTISSYYMVCLLRNVCFSWNAPLRKLLMLKEILWKRAFFSLWDLFGGQYHITYRFHLSFHVISR